VNLGEHQVQKFRRETQLDGFVVVEKLRRDELTR